MRIFSVPLCLCPDSVSPRWLDGIIGRLKVKEDKAKGGENKKCQSVLEF